MHRRGSRFLPSSPAGRFGLREGLSVLVCPPGNQAEHLALLLADQLVEWGRWGVAVVSGLDRAAGSTRRRLSDHVIQVISPRHRTVSGQPGPHPQASRPAHPPDPRPPRLSLCGGRQGRDHRPVAAQHLCTAAQVIFRHTHPARLASTTVAAAGGRHRNSCRAGWQQIAGSGLRQASLLRSHEIPHLPRHGHGQT
jgi:hypothetical protein